MRKTNLQTHQLNWECLYQRIGSEDKKIAKIKRGKQVKQQAMEDLNFCSAI